MPNHNKKPSHMEQLRHELLEDLVTQTTGLLADFNLPAEKAEHCAVALANHLAVHWGGQLINFPKDYVFKIAARDIEIYNAFNGQNHSELARKYDISVRTIYKIITKMRALMIADKQPRLFDDV